MTRFMSEKLFLADAVAKKASVESVRIAMNFDFMINPSLIKVVFSLLCPNESNNHAKIFKGGEFA